MHAGPGRRQANVQSVMTDGARRGSAAHGTNAFARATPRAGLSRAWWRSASRPDLLADEDFHRCVD